MCVCVCEVWGLSVGRGRWQQLLHNGVSLLRRRVGWVCGWMHAKDEGMASMPQKEGMCMHCKGRAVVNPQAVPCPTGGLQQRLHGGALLTPEWQWQVEAARPTARWGTYPPTRPHLARCATSWQASGVRMVRYSGRTGAEILTPPMT